MITNIFPIPAFTDNYIWTFEDSDNGHTGVVDPGDAAPVIEYLEQSRKRLTHILITHHHPDHVGGVDVLLRKFNPLVYGPDSAKFKSVSEVLRDGDRFELFGESAEVLAVPGHTLDHIAYYIPKPTGHGSPVLFCGDTLFAAGCGRIFEGNPEMMFNSLQKLAHLDTRSEVYCTHEYTLANLKFAVTADPENANLHRRIEKEAVKRKQNLPTLPSTIGLELATNPFLRCNKPELISSAKARKNLESLSAVTVFATLRQWKDNF